jgi:hypothetical protein
MKQMSLFARPSGAKVEEFPILAARNHHSDRTMSRRFTPKVVTANALIEGDVVYLTADDQWSRIH